MRESLPLLSKIMSLFRDSFAADFGFSRCQLEHVPTVGNSCSGIWRIIYSVNGAVLCHLLRFPFFALHRRCIKAALFNRVRPPLLKGLM